MEMCIAEPAPPLGFPSLPKAAEAGSHEILFAGIGSMVIDEAKEVLKIEAQSILGLMDRIGAEFEKAIEIILENKGRLILTGMGKSGLIGRKIAATLNSTGTPSLFLHPAEAIHGDLGMVTPNDIVLAISNSGNTGEINTLLPLLKKMGVKILALTGNPDSPMTKMCDLVIDVAVEREACPMGMAPTASTTAALAMGDALAVVLVKRRRFNPDDFRRFHPGGSLGDRLGIKVKEIMLTGKRIPTVPLGSEVQRAIEEIEKKGIGATLVSHKEGKLAGILTDGDLRRMLLNQKNMRELKVEDVMSPSPWTIDQNSTTAEALASMEMHSIMHLVIVDGDDRIRGIVHLHDLLGREEFRVNGAFHRTPGTHR